MRGIVQGHRGIGNLMPEVHLKYQDSEVILPAGAMLYTDDGEGQVFPPNLRIGRVLEQIKGDYYDSAKIEPQVDFAQLDSVFVIRMEEEVEGEEALDEEADLTENETPAEEAAESETP